ncbi:MAG: Na/Pi cotransporter family protein [Halanaerobiales bacterium]|nr:Na/Pi cotransporter family protein [Halanaerobiales bacterium]
MSFDMVVGLTGGLGLFIYGMKQMSEGLQKTAGKRLRHILAFLTNNTFSGVLVGTGVTSIVQSSSATTVMVVGFVNAGLMTLKQSIGVIMGANIGTTVTAQLISFDLGDYAFHAITLGAIAYLFANKKKYQYIGQVILGFGILFLGLNIMSETMNPLRDSQYIVELMKNFGKYPILGVLAGMTITVVIQSSSATFGILVGLVSVGVIDFNSGVPILLGSNIGTTVTAILSAIGASKTAKKSAAAHFIFNILGTSIMILLIYVIPDFTGHLRELLRSVSQVTNNTISSERLLANTHTLFNVTNTLIWMPFVGFMVHLVNKIIPGEDISIERGLVHIDERMLNTPQAALTQVHKEVTRMHSIVEEMILESKKAVIEKDTEMIKKIRHKEEIVNEIEEELLVFLTNIPQTSLSDEDIKTLDSFFAIVDDVESIGDDGNSIADLAEYIIENDLEFSEEAIKSIENAYDIVTSYLGDSREIIETGNEDLAEKLFAGEEEMDDILLQYREDHLKRLNKGVCIPSAGIAYLEVLEDLEHISDQFADIAYSIIERKKNRIS